MGISFSHQRTVSLPLNPDADPNVSAPDPKSVFKLQYRPDGTSQLLTISHVLFFETDSPAPAAAIQFRTWQLDQESKLWSSVPDASVLVGNEILGTGIANPDLFVQLLSTSGPLGTAGELTLHLAEQGVPGPLGYASGSSGPSTVVEGKGSAGLPVGGVLTVQGDPAGTPIPVDASISDVAASTTIVSDVPTSPTTVVLLAPNSARLQLTIFNDSNRQLTIKLGAGASAVSRTTQIPPRSEYAPPTRYTGIITGFWDAGATGSAAVTELTP